MTRFRIAEIATCFAIFFLAMAFTTEVKADTPPPEVQRAAKDGLVRFLATIPTDELARLGFRTPEDVRAATLGTPYEQFTFTTEALAAYKSGTLPSTLLSGTDTWLFPVMVSGEARTVLTVSKVNGQWEAGNIGGTNLPVVLQAAEANLPTLLKQKGMTSAQKQFVRVFQLNADFLVVGADGAEYMVPLMADPSRFNLKANALYTPDQVIPQLKAMMNQSKEPGQVGGGPIGGEAKTESNPIMPHPEPAATQEQGSSGFPLYLLGAMAVLALVTLGIIIAALLWKRQSRVLH